MFLCEAVFNQECPDLQWTPLKNCHCLIAIIKIQHQIFWFEFWSQHHRFLLFMQINWTIIIYCLLFENFFPKTNDIVGFFLDSTFFGLKNHKKFHNFYWSQKWKFEHFQQTLFFNLFMFIYQCYVFMWSCFWSGMSRFAMDTTQKLSLLDGNIKNLNIKIFDSDSDHSTTDFYYSCKLIEQ